MGVRPGSAAPPQPQATRDVYKLCFQSMQQSFLASSQPKLPSFFTKDFKYNRRGTFVISSDKPHITAANRQCSRPMAQNQCQPTPDNQRLLGHLPLHQQHLWWGHHTLQGTGAQPNPSHWTPQPRILIYIYTSKIHIHVPVWFIKSRLGESRPSCT